MQKFCNRAENCCIAIEQMREKLSARRRFQGERLGENTIRFTYLPA